jgi:hypothetical protein
MLIQRLREELANEMGVSSNILLWKSVKSFLQGAPAREAVRTFNDCFRKRLSYGAAYQRVLHAGTY